MQDYQTFFEQANQQFSAEGATTKTNRVSRSCSGPSGLLALDALLAPKVEQYTPQSRADKIDRGLIDRSYIHTARLVVTNFYTIINFINLYLYNKLYFLYIDIWAKPPRIYNASADAAQRSEVAQARAAEKVTGVTWAASILGGSSFAGHYPVPLPTVSYQLEGARLIAIADVMDLLEFLQENDSVDCTFGPGNAQNLLQDGVDG